MKRELLEALEALEEARKKLTNNPELLAPQFRPTALSRLAVVESEILNLVDFCIESEQLNGGLN